MYANQNLLDCDGWLPALIFVEDAETDSTRWVDVRMEERWDKFAFGWLRWILFRKAECQFEEAAFPDGLLLVRTASLSHGLEQTLSLPGMPQSHVLRSITPCEFLTGRANMPKG